MSERPILKFIIESLLFSSEKPLSISRIKDIVGGGGDNAAQGSSAEPAEIKQCIEELNNTYNANSNSFIIQEVAGGFQLRTRPEYHQYISELHRRHSEGVLSNAALETLSIIVYKQPIIRAEIESIRGVDSSAIIRGLMEKKLVRIVGRAEALGRPLLYGTTNNFLELLGLPSIKDLPKIEDVHPV
ncbi:MAG: SMC-Scp complex subunit ScpB [Planctomycetota bacterium]|nr:SMC-Scp complex subunit ScpB [Planctomycetota bacterium]MDI6788287.1 SMC-Scp complex subunit ScpB [Planctomycetota bacterium]